MDGTKWNKEKFKKIFEDLTKKWDQRDEAEAKLYDWYLFFIEEDGESTPETALRIKESKKEKLTRMKKRIGKQIIELQTEIMTLRQIVRRRAEQKKPGDYASGSDPKDVPNI